ncbi:MAG: hypothetical protein WCF12_07440 [Propionicimonas sp.]
MPSELTAGTEIVEVRNSPDAFMEGDAVVGEAEVVGAGLADSEAVGLAAEAVGLAAVATTGGRDTLPVGFPARWTGADSALAHTARAIRTTTPAAIASASRDVNHRGARSHEREGGDTPSP